MERICQEHDIDLDDDSDDVSPSQSSTARCDWLGDVDADFNLDDLIGATPLVLALYRV